MAAIDANNSVTITPQRLDEFNREALNKKKQLLQSTDHNYYISRTVKWLRGEGQSTFNQVLRRIAAVALAAFLALSIIGIGVLLTGIKEWKHQAAAVSKGEERDPQERKPAEALPIPEEKGAETAFTPVIPTSGTEGENDKAKVSHDPSIEEDKILYKDFEKEKQLENEWCLDLDVDPAAASPYAKQKEYEEVVKKCSSVASAKLFGQTAGNCTWTSAPSFSGTNPSFTPPAPPSGSFNPTFTPPAPPSQYGTSANAVGSLGGRRVSVFTGQPAPPSLYSTSATAFGALGMLGHITDLNGKSATEFPLGDYILGKNLSTSKTQQYPSFPPAQKIECSGCENLTELPKLPDSLLSINFKTEKEMEEYKNLTGVKLFPWEIFNANFLDKPLTSSKVSENKENNFQGSEEVDLDRPIPMRIDPDPLVGQHKDLDDTDLYDDYWNQS